MIFRRAHALWESRSIVIIKLEFDLHNCYGLWIDALSGNVIVLGAGIVTQSIELGNVRRRIDLL